MMWARRIAAVAVVCAGWIPLTSAELTPAIKQAFSRYIDLFEQNWNRAPQTQPYLYIDGDPAARAKVRAGQTLILPRKTLDSGREIKTPGGLIQDWLGVIFIPDAGLEHVRTVMQDYGSYKRFFAPEVIESRQLHRTGNDFNIFLRLYKRQIVPVLFNANYDVHYSAPGPRRLAIVSRSTRIAQLKDPGNPNGEEETVGNDDGFLWTLNSYWRFQEADGGVYGECEAISLSRDVPFGLSWMLGKFLEHFPKDSMENTLEGVRKAALAHGTTGDVDRER